MSDRESSNYEGLVGQKRERFVTSFLLHMQVIEPEPEPSSSFGY